MNFIIGTAGHIDHGKTTLIKALTGRQTDRFKEEQKRGISIDLGFTYFDLPSKTRVGIIDVPGHERFIKNMIAGATGIDLVLFVVAADEGPMPQTMEHLNILRFLDVKDAIIVLTKWEKSDEIMRELVLESLKEMQEDPENDMPVFFQQAPIIPVDSLSGWGIETLIQKIDEKAQWLVLEETKNQVRLPVDRVFTLKGLGTVITGTLTEGVISLGDELMIYPQGLQTKIRSIQVHDADKEKAYKGQRTALNLANIKKEEVARGDVIATIDSLEVTSLLDIKLTILKNAPVEIKHFTRGRIYLGAKEVIGRIIPLGEKTIKPGQTAFAQIRLEEALVAKKGDLFVLRQFSPLITIGGGVIVDANPRQHKATDSTITKKLEKIDQGSPLEILQGFIYAGGISGVAKKEIMNYMNLSFEVVDQMLLTSVTEKILYTMGDRYWHREIVEATIEKIAAALEIYHQDYPLRKGLEKDVLRQQLNISLEQKILDELLEKEATSPLILKEGNYIALKNFEIHYTPEDAVERNKLVAEIKTRGFEPPNIKEWRLSEKQLEMVEEQIGQTLIRLDHETVTHQEVVEKAKEKLKKWFQTEETISLGDFRDILETTRKYAILFLEYFDRQRITLRFGDERKLFKKDM